MLEPYSSGLPRWFTSEHTYHIFSEYDGAEETVKINQQRKTVIEKIQKIHVPQSSSTTTVGVPRAHSPGEVANIYWRKKFMGDDYLATIEVSNGETSVLGGNCCSKCW